MMKKIIVVTVVAALAVLGMEANPISVDRAMEIAAQFTQQGHLKSFSGNHHQLQLAYASWNTRGSVDYYVINREADNGFIIVAGDDISMPVWGYSEQGTFDIYQIPENMRWWLSEYQRQLQWMCDHPETQPRKSVIISKSMGPLLQMSWNQTKPFNNYSPLVSGGPNGRAYSGCVATAMAQIMKYYNHPQKGYGSNSYTFMMNGSPVTLSADFSQSTYRWGEMLYYYYTNGYSATEATAVAQLIRDAGIAVNTKYGAEGSSANTNNVLVALVSYFDYSPSISYLLKDEYSGSWDRVLKSEIDARRPILYRGNKSESQGGGGHAFVVDGYDNAGYYHINWGWGGNYNGYFAIDLFTPYYQSHQYGEGYNTYQGAIIGIERDNSGAGGIVLKSSIVPGNSVMPANDVRASIDVQALNGPYTGTLRVGIATQKENGGYTWEDENEFTEEISVEADQVKRIDLIGSFNLTEGKTYYFILLNPYITCVNYLWCDAVPFTVAVLPPIPGDVNNDKAVNISDVNAVIDLILSGGDSSNGRADVNGDGIINITDINLIIHIILDE